MEGLMVSEILKATKGQLIGLDEDFVVNSISTDSRKIEPNCVFIPLAGEKFDGHDFIETAFENGAICVLTHKDIPCPSGKIMIKVDDTLKALQDIAKYYKSKFNIPFVAVTGSVGKTTTKEMIAVVLEQKYEVLKTKGNFNNEIGLPLTLLEIGSAHQIGVVEMGMSSFGEISRLSNITNPDTAVITNIGVSHIQNLGSQENILKAKLEVLEGMNNSGHLILNADDKFLNGLNLEIENIHYYGINSTEGIHPYDIKDLGQNGSTFKISILGREHTIYVPVPGEHNIYNSLAAIQVGLIYQVPIEKAIEGIKNFVPSGMRQNIFQIHDNIQIIEDCYNASPQSMKAALSVLGNMNARRRIAVLGDMLELGHYSQEGHRQVGEFAASSGVDYLFLIGSQKDYIMNGAVQKGFTDEKIFSFESHSELSNCLNKFIETEDAVLVKGSRGMKMEQIVNAVREMK